LLTEIAKLFADFEIKTRHIILNEHFCFLVCIEIVLNIYNHFQLSGEIG